MYGKNVGSSCKLDMKKCFSELEGAKRNKMNMKGILWSVGKSAKIWFIGNFLKKIQ